MDTKIAIVITITCFYVALVTAKHTDQCPVYFAHTQFRFCHSSAVLAVKVLKLNYKHDRAIHFRVKVLHIYKDTRLDFTDGQITWIYKSHPTSKTRFRFRRMKVYVITVSYTLPRKYYIDDCGLYKRQKYLSPNERKGINGAYDCSCQIMDVRNPKYDGTRHRDKCYLEDNNRGCLVKNAFCQYINGKCAWRGKHIGKC